MASSLARRVPYGLAVALLLGIFAAQSFSSMLLLSPASDEAAHLGAGYQQLVTGEVRLNPEHPPLVKVLAALPLLFMDLKARARAAEARHQWDFGRALLYENDADRVLRWARVPMLAIALLLGFLVWRWSRDLFGPAAGLLALFLFAFSPNLIAHSRFVTMDVPLACFMLAASYSLWAWTVRRRLRDLVLAGLATGAALSTKFSATVLIPSFGFVLLALLAWWRWSGADPPERPRRPLTFVLVTAAALAALAIAVVWGAYGFPPGPGPYLEGLANVNLNRKPDMPAYLMGEFRPGSFPSYFAFAMLFKTPEVTALLFVASLVFFAARRDRPVVAALFLLIPPALFFLATSLFAANLGHRYVLPLYGFALVFASQLAQLRLPRRLAVGACVVLGAWHVYWTLAIWPHHVAFFNRVSGGPEHGFELLADSNLDWGQSLKFVKRWAEREGVGEFWFSEPWPSGDPAYWGLETRRVTFSELSQPKPPPGIYVMNLHTLIYGNYYARRRGIPSNWLERFEPVDRIGYAYLVYRFD